MQGIAAILYLVAALLAILFLDAIFTPYPILPFKKEGCRIL